MFRGPAALLTLAILLAGLVPTNAKRSEQLSPPW